MVLFTIEVVVVVVGIDVELYMNGDWDRIDEIVIGYWCLLLLLIDGIIDDVGYRELLGKVIFFRIGFLIRFLLKSMDILCDVVLMIGVNKGILGYCADDCAVVVVVVLVAVVAVLKDTSYCAGSRITSENIYKLCISFCFDIDYISMYILLLEVYLIYWYNYLYIHVQITYT